MTDELRAVSFYHKDTGLFNGVHLTSSDPSLIPLNTPTDHVAIDGHHDPLAYAVDLTQPTPVVVDYIPPAPSTDHEWDSGTKRWNVKANVQARIDARRCALAQIGELEASQHRALREAALHASGAVDRLKEIDEAILLLRLEL